MANYGFVIAIQRDPARRLATVSRDPAARARHGGAPHAFSLDVLRAGKTPWEARWRSRRFTDVAFNVLAVDAAGTAVGMVSGVEGDPVELISLWVAPDARGRGVGDLLVRAVLGYAGTRPTRLNVYPDNAPAIALYRRHGFAELGGVV